VTETAQERSRRLYLERHKRYNNSRKGQKRNRAYEDAHPHRKVRWEPARNKTGRENV
jgi:hypothetical protein